MLLHVCHNIQTIEPTLRDYNPSSIHHSICVDRSLGSHLCEGQTLHQAVNAETILNVN